MRQYRIGDGIHLVGTFRDPVNAQLRNPDTVVCRVLSPDMVETRPAVNQASVGVYTAQFTPTKAGIWYARWESLGSLKVAIDNQFEVTPSPFPSLT